MGPDPGVRTGIGLLVKWLCPSMAGCRIVVVIGLVPDHWWVELGLMSGEQGYLEKYVYRQLWSQEDFRQPVCLGLSLCLYPAGCLA